MKTEIPDDIDALKTMVHQQQVLLKQLQAQMCRYEGQVAGYEREIERLKSQLDKLKRMLFGQSSEKLRNKLEKKIREAEKTVGRNGRPAAYRQGVSGGRSSGNGGVC
ncbi:Transposase and inactivated derivatives [Serratia odorifera]|uniref:Transposase and inactivated derivatives n=1 Tax=Serratia odorifera TaxID=618 RepID=A0A447KK06_SEROD|nr:Transposase and inactivated derivatives [Serratia odorifera]